MNSKSIYLFFTLLIFNIGAIGQIGFSNSGMNNAAVYSQSKGGSSVLIMKDGNIIFEDYHNGADSTTAAHLHSATKFFWSSVAALAIQDNLISDFEEKVANTITEWQDVSAHPNKNLIKINHLLALSSGLSQDVTQIQGTNAGASDIYEYVVDSLRLNFVPGNKFQYGPSHYYAFGVLLQRKLHNAGEIINPLQYLENEIFDIIGLEYESWVHDSSGNPNIPNGCTITPRNWLKFGQFMLQKGNWNGKQIIDSILLEEMFITDGPNPGHGKFCWLNNINGYGAYSSIAAPPGSLGGFIYHKGYTEIIGGLGAGKTGCI